MLFYVIYNLLKLQYACEVKRTFEWRGYWVVYGGDGMYHLICKTVFLFFSCWFVAVKTFHIYVFNNANAENYLHTISKKSDFWDFGRAFALQD